MTRYRRLFRLFLGTDPEIEREVEEEIRSHLEMRTAELERRGLSPQAARAEAERRFGDVERARRGLGSAARVRQGRQRRHDWLASVAADASLALRRARSTPTQTLAAVVTFMLAIGLTTAGFTVVDRVLIRSLPFPDADRLVALETADSTGAGIRYISTAVWLDWVGAERTLASSALHSSRTERWTFAWPGDAGREPFKIDGVMVTPGFFDVLRVPMVAGRGFVEEDAERAVAMVSEGFWRGALGSAALPVEVELNGRLREVVGVVRRGLEYPPGTVAYLPFVPRYRGGEAYNWLNFFGVARLDEGATREQASADLAAIARASGRSHPEAVYLHGAGAIPLRDHVVGDARSYLGLLMGAVTVLLLIACANLAGLGVARASTRGPELALRISLGAGRRRLVRQLLTEHLSLALVGGGLGVVLAYLATGAVADRAAGQLPRAAEIGMDLRVLGFACVVTVGAGLLAGIVPALWASRGSPRPGLVGGRGTAAGGRGTPGALLVGIEVALALVLLTGGGLLLRSFVLVLDRDLGYDVEGIVAAESSLTGRHDVERWPSFWAELEDRIAARPGVASVGFASAIPTGIGGTGFIEVEGLADRRAGAAYRVVSDRYFETMGIALLEGRSFDRRDQRGTERVTVVNRSMADRYWPGESPIGMRVKAYSMEGRDGTPETAPWLTVVGLVEDIRHHGHVGDTDPEMYVSLRQAPHAWHLSAMTTVVRGRPGLPADRLASPVRAAFREQDPGLAVEIATLDARLSELLSTRGMILVVLAGFAALSLLLAALGLYGLLSFAVSRSMREMGIRSALGAQRARILWLVLRRALGVVVIGAAAGLVVAFWATRLLEALLVDVAPRDPVSFAAALAVLLAVSTAAALVPARRATRADPVESLRAS
ncbi:MAG TPA: ADOP family duplicated permease [Longimicrobiales bacterium]|nr:ADOP family duplicated permease [Longimicrobiales bacterium]